VTLHTISFAIAFSIITFLHIVLGELAPKSVALQRAEETALLVSRPIHLFLAVFRWPIIALNSVGNAVVRLIGIQPAAGHTLVQSAEELKLAVSASREAGLVSEAAQEVVRRALDFTELQAHHVMVPRPEIVAVRHDVQLAELVELVERNGHSRYPVYEGSIDQIVGVVTAKSLLGSASRQGSEPFDVRRHMTPPVFVPETISAYRLLGHLKHHRAHLAIALDEYGITAGLVTLRDLTAHISGEVLDEAEDAPHELQWLTDGSALVNGLASLRELNDGLGVEIDDEDYDTIGGVVFGRLGRRPEIGDVVEAEDYVFVVEQLDGLRIAQLRILPRQGPSDELAVEASVARSANGTGHPGQ